MTKGRIVRSIPMSAASLLGVAGAHPSLPTTTTRALSRAAVGLSRGLGAAVILGAGLCMGGCGTSSDLGGGDASVSIDGSSDRDSGAHDAQHEGPTIALRDSGAGVLTCACGYAADAACDEARLWADIHELGVYTVGGSCGEDPDGSSGTIQGTVVFDSEGQAVGLEALANYRWPCWAGQTIRYSCVSGYE